MSVRVLSAECLLIDCSRNAAFEPVEGRLWSRCFISLSKGYVGPSADFEVGEDAREARRGEERE